MGPRTERGTLRRAVEDSFLQVVNVHAAGIRAKEFEPDFEGTVQLGELMLLHGDEAVPGDLVLPGADARIGGRASSMDEVEGLLGDGVARDSETQFRANYSSIQTNITIQQEWILQTPRDTQRVRTGRRVWEREKRLAS